MTDCQPLVEVVAGHLLHQTSLPHLPQRIALPKTLDVAPLNVHQDLRVAVERVVEGGRLREKDLRLGQQTQRGRAERLN